VARCIEGGCEIEFGGCCRVDDVDVDVDDVDVDIDDDVVDDGVAGDDVAGDDVTGDDVAVEVTVTGRFSSIFIGTVFGGV
jgi:hypothetical protein